MGTMESPSSWKVVKLVFLRKPDAAPAEGVRSYRAIALTSVMSKWYASYILLRLVKEKEPEKWKKLHIGGLDDWMGFHWEWQEVRMRGKQFRFQLMLVRTKRGSPTLVAKDGNPDIGQRGGRMDEAKKRCSYGN